MDLKLRDYQKEVLEIIDKLEPGSYLIQMATGLNLLHCILLVCHKFLMLQMA